MPLSRPRLALRIALACLVVAGLGSMLRSWATREVVDPRPRRAGPFLATPYLQIGEAPTADSLALLWHADDRDAGWSVQVQSPISSPWRPAEGIDWRAVRLDGVERHRVYRASLKGLAPGEPFRYRVGLGGAVAFEAEAMGRPAAGRPHRFAAFGDCGSNTPGQRKIAYQVHRARPDYAVVTGDIVYFRGTVGEYRSKFFPIFAATTASPTAGAPLLGSVPFIAAPGNHDTMTRNFDVDPDLMAYFYYWSQPLNGPNTRPDGRNTPPRQGSKARLRAFDEAAGANFPKMGTFSFNAGDVHWTFLDSDPYVHWSDPDLRAWVELDLMAARDKPWRFVAFHHPGFHSSTDHAREQQMRLLCDVFERNKVAIVFSGHVHNYERSYPLRYTVATHPGSLAPEPSNPVAGTLTIDRDYDGTTRTRPSGVIYLVTGAGGARLYDPGRTSRPELWQPFTRKFVADAHSFTVVDVTPDVAHVRQVDADGTIIDEFAVAR